MGWASKAAKLGIEAIRKAPNKRALWSEITAAKAMDGKAGKTVSRGTYREMLGRSGDAYFGDGGKRVKNALTTARRMKAQIPDIYEKAKRAIHIDNAVRSVDKYRKTISEKKRYWEHAVPAKHEAMDAIYWEAKRRNKAAPDAIAHNVMAKLRLLNERNLLPASVVASLGLGGRKKER